MDTFYRVRQHLANDLGGPEWTYEDFRSLTLNDLQTLIDESRLSTRMVGIFRHLHTENRLETGEYHRIFV